MNENAEIKARRGLNWAIARRVSDYIEAMSYPEKVESEAAALAELEQDFVIVERGSNWLVATHGKQEYADGTVHPLYIDAFWRD